MLRDAVQLIAEPIEGTNESSAPQLVVVGQFVMKSVRSVTTSGWPQIASQAVADGIENQEDAPFPGRLRRAPGCR